MTIDNMQESSRLGLVGHERPGQELRTEPQKSLNTIVFTCSRVYWIMEELNMLVELEKYRMWNRKCERKMVWPMVQWIECMEQIIYEPDDRCMGMVRD